MDTAKALLAAIAIFVVVAILGVASWQLGWFVEAKNVDRRTQVQNLSLGRQQALTRNVSRNIAEVRDIDTQEQTPAVLAQRKAIVSVICEDADLLSGSVTLSASAEQFIYQECP